MVGAAFSAPFAYLCVRAAQTGAVAELASRTTLGPLLRTIALAGTVAASTAVLGLGCAWLTTRTDLPFARALALLLTLPLVLPSYIGAFTLQAAFASGGLADQVLGVRFGRVQGFWAAAGVLTVLTFPYVLLPTAARLRQVPAALEESSRLLGHGPWATFATVVWPQVRAAVLAGALLVFLYVVSDFGAVQLLRVDTLTRAAYASFLDRTSFLSLGLQLALLAVAIGVAERLAARRAAPLARGSRALCVPLGRWRIPALAGLGSVIAVSLVAPLSVLVYWAVRGLAGGGGLAGTVTRGLVGPLMTSTGAGLTAAVVATVMIVPVAILVGRHGGAPASTVNALVLGGFALPGLVIALALSIAALQGPSVLAGAYQSFPLLIFAYVVHFGAQSLRSAEVGVVAIPPRVRDAARMLGAGRLRRLATVDLPLLAPSLFAGAGLVLLSTLKELPATLLLAPIGTSTLATRVWDATEGAFWAEASLAALLLVALSGVLTWFLVLRRADALA